MDEIKDEKGIPVISSLAESEHSNVNSPIKSDYDEGSEKKMEVENSIISETEVNNGVTSSFPLTLLKNSDEKTPAVENFGMSISEVKDIKTENNLDHLQVEDKTLSVNPDDGTSNMSGVRCNDLTDISSEIKLSENTCKSEPLSELGHSQIEEGASEKAMQNAGSGESLSSISEENSNEIGPMPVTVEAAVVPPVEVRDMQSSDSINVVEDSNALVALVGISAMLLPEKDIEESNQFSASDLSDTGPISSGVAITPSQVKDMEEFDSNKNLEMEVKNNLNNSDNGTSAGDINVQGNADGNIFNNFGSPDSTSQSLPLDESQVENETTEKSLESTKTSTQILKIQKNRGFVDTSAPFESVKSAVSKFGGITDWKAHRSQTLERRKQVQHELEKIQGEIPHYKKQSEAAEYEKTRVLEELDSTKRLIEELKLSLEKAETEEAQAKQDSELAQLRIREIEQGIAREASVAAKEQLNVARARHAAALAELVVVKDELKKIQEEYNSLVTERDMAIKRAEEAILASKEIEKTVEDLTLELITAREELESAHAAHMEAEEHRIGASLARDQDSLNWEKELKLVEDEVRQLNEKLLSIEDLQSKFDAASTLLLNLKSELTVYMEAKLLQESESRFEENKESEPAEATKTHASVQAEVTLAKKELEEVKGKIEKAREEVNFLKVAAVSLKSKLDTEKAALATMRQREGMASIAVSSLEAELNRTKMEIESVQAKEKEVREQMVNLPKAIQQASLEADEAKSAAQSAQEELKKAKEESEQARASKSTMESRLHAALKEIEATRASEKLALAAIKALQESEQASELSQEEPNTSVALPLEKYYALSKEAHEAEKQASERVSAALSQIEVARESEARSLASLESTIKELVERKEALRLAMEKAEKAKEGKLSVEQELRNWRAENERRRKANDASQPTTTTINHLRSPGRSFEGSKESKVFVSDQEATNLSQTTPSITRMYTPESTENVFPEAKVKKKKSLFPRIVMFLARKKSSSTSS